MNLSDGVAALKERKLSAVIWVPDTLPDAQEPVKITLYTLQNDLQSAIVDVKLKDIFLKYETNLREIRADRLHDEPVPLSVPKASGGGDFYEFVYGLLIPLLVFMPAIIASALVIDLLTEEYQHETLETLISTPVTFTEMVWGKVLACELMVPIQAGAWLLLLMINGIAIENAGLILLQVSVTSLHPDPARDTHRPPLPRADGGPVHLLDSARGRHAAGACPPGQSAQPADPARGGHGRSGAVDRARGNAHHHPRARVRDP